MKKIITVYEWPAIPIRDFDWRAHWEGEEEGGHYGYGRTEADAIADLRRMDEERFEASLSDEDFAKHFPYAQE